MSDHSIRSSNAQAHDNNLSISEAAARLKTSKTTVFRRINAGKIIARKDEFGEYRISPDSLNGFRTRKRRGTFVEEQPVQTGDARLDNALLVKLRDTINLLLDLTIAIEQRVKTQPRYLRMNRARKQSR